MIRSTDSLRAGLSDPDGLLSRTAACTVGVGLVGQAEALRELGACIVVSGLYGLLED